jgi:molecular chaperone GrpE
MSEQEVDARKAAAKGAATQLEGADAAAEAEAIQQAAEENVSRAELEQAKAEVTQLKSERDQLVDRLARLQAEFENARKRAEREKAEFRDFATGNVVEQFLPVLDNFELALKATGSADQMRSGVELIVKQMEDVLRGLNVQPVESVGSVFDPKVHEALEMVEREDLPDHQVFDEVRRGYRIRERLLRPALVRVASNSQQKEA